jgi:tetratricopeptide (TPR) repeat protein
VIIKFGKPLVFILAGILNCFLFAGRIAAEPTETAIGLFQAGKAAQDEENYYLAIEKYKASLVVNPRYIDPVKGLAQCFFYLDEYAESLRYVAEGKILNKNDLSLLALEGRINVVTGHLDKANELFTAVLSREPNNIEAMTGIALLEIAAGRTSFATKQLEDALVLNPTERTTLLSLALINESLGNLASANRYIELALKYHSNNYLVHYIAGRTYYMQAELGASESNLKSSLALRGDYEPARLLLGNLYVVMRKEDRAIEILRPLLASNPESVLARYLIGIAYWNKKDLANAINSLQGALGLDADDESSRLALEQLAIAELDQKNPKRSELARYRYEQGQLFEQRNLLDSALLEYRRAIKLDPVSKDARTAFAGIFKRRGFPLKYLNELEVLKELGITDRGILDDIEYYRTQGYGTVSEKWNLDQHDIDMRTLSLEVFTLVPRNSLFHPASGAIIAALFSDVLDGYGKIKVIPTNPTVASFEEAFRAARTGKADFFIILNFSEGERSFYAKSRLYLSKTGTLLSELSTERTGNGRIRDSLLRLGSSINDILPVRGVLLKKEFDRGVIDLGRIHGLKEKDSLVIVKAGKVSLTSDAIGFTYAENDVVGQITLDNIDEAVAEGSLAKKTFYDYISTGDEVLFLPKTQPTVNEASAIQGTTLLQELVDLK